MPWPAALKSGWRYASRPMAAIIWDELAATGKLVTWRFQTLEAGKM
jgi:hypothetical protein